MTLPSFTFYVKICMIFLKCGFSSLLNLHFTWLSFIMLGAQWWSEDVYVRIPVCTHCMYVNVTIQSPRAFLMLLGNTLSESDLGNCMS